MGERIDRSHPMLTSRAARRVRRVGAPGVIAVLAAMLALSGCGESKDGDESTKINGSIHVPAGKPPGAVATVNGSIHIDDQAAVTSATTVNGSVHLGDHAAATSLSSVNGSIALGDGAHVSGSASSVNGSMNIAGASHVEGGILVEKPSSELLQLVRDVPRIVIGPGATVQGDLRFERTVQLFVSDKATIGPVTGATAIPFTGDTPPS